jgi:uncharacterized protein YceK
MKIQVSKRLIFSVVISLLIVIFLSGCSSSPKVTAQKPQYCYTSETIQLQNGERVDSKTVVECSDDQIKRMPAVRLGMSPNCGQFTYWTKIGGRDVQRQGISCQKLNGTWEVINTTGY